MGTTGERAAATPLDLDGVRVGVLGGGWYGCRIAAALVARGCDVQLFEQRDQLLAGASGNNQFRLHLGFHHARHQETRVQTKAGFERFVVEHPTWSRAVPQNLYAVSAQESLLDVGTYRTVMTSSGLPFTEPEAPVLDLVGVQGLLGTPERVLLTEQARAGYTRMLGDVVHLGRQVRAVEDHDTRTTVDGQHFDVVVDATWGHHTPLALRVVFEPTLLLYYCGPVDFPALTLVDGPLCSVYPTSTPGLFTLSSVPWTPLGRCRTVEQAEHLRAATGVAAVESRRRRMEEQVSRYLPGFRDLFTYAGPQLSMKTKTLAAHEDRSCRVEEHGRVLVVMSGKVDAMFVAEERVAAAVARISRTRAARPRRAAARPGSTRPALGAGTEAR